MPQVPRDPHLLSEASLREVGARLRELREGQGLTLMEAAHKLGLHWGTIQRIEVGARAPSFDVLIRLLDLYEARLSIDLVPLEERRESTDNSGAEPHEGESEKSATAFLEKIGLWEDSRTTEEIIREIYEARGYSDRVPVF